jgi:hypothetical protein
VNEINIERKSEVDKTERDYIVEKGREKEKRRRNYIKRYIIDRRRREEWE